MTGENPQASPPASPTPSAAAPSPVAAAPVSAPAEAAPVAAPVAEAPKAPVAEAPKETPKAAEPAADSLLGAEPGELPKEAKTDAPPADAPKVDPKAETKVEAQPGEQNKESSQSQPAPLPTYEPFKLPEGVTVDEARLGEFTKDLAEFELAGKADHAVTQALGQKFLDKHIAALQEHTQRITDYYQNAFDKQKSEWKSAIEKDPVLGGNRIKTTMTEIANTIASVSTKEQHQAFRDYASQSGIGNNPVVAHIVHNLTAEINRLRTKYESEKSVKPLPAQPSAKAEPVSKVAKRYGGSQ